MTLVLELPNSDALAELDRDYLKETLVATLYNLGKLSEKEACEILGTSRRQFEELLPKYGFSVLGDSEEDIATELNA